MDLIYTNAEHRDQGVFGAYKFDLSFGNSENNFELTLGAAEPEMEYGSIVYIEGTEYGGVVDGMKVSSNADTITYKGRTWHGLLNSKIIEPDTGADYYTVSGEANAILSSLVARMSLGSLFVVDDAPSGITIRNYSFARYCAGYDGIRDMLSDHGAKLRIAWQDRTVRLSAAPIADYSESGIDNDTATLAVEEFANKVNHLVCLGQGDLAQRTVVHLYANQYGAISSEQYYFGVDEYSAVYENTGAASAEELTAEGIKRFKTLRSNDTADISISEYGPLAYDIGDLIGATELRSGVSAVTAVTQKIVKINNGVCTIRYKTGG